MAQNAAIKLPKGVHIHGKYLRIAFSYNGKRQRESLKLEPTKQNIKFAQMKLETIKYEIATNTFVYSNHFADSKHITGKPANKSIGELVEIYLRSKVNDVRKSTYLRYTSTLNIFAVTYGKHRNVTTLSPLAIAEVRTTIIHGKTARTSNGYMRIIAGFFKWLHAMQYLDIDYSSQLKRIKVPEREIKPFTHDELQLCLANCRQEQHHNMIALLAYSGLRIGELCALAWEDINFKEKTMLIRRATYDQRGLKTTKTDKERVVDILPPAMEALKSQRKLTWLFKPKFHDVELPDKTIRKDKIRFVFSPKVMRGEYADRIFEYDYLGKTAPNKMWERICRNAGVPYRTVYQLRHTYASWMLSSGVNISYLAKQMGHSDFLMIAKVYGKWMDDPKKKESEKAWEKLQAVHG